MKYFENAAKLMKLDFKDRKTYMVVSLGSSGSSFIAKSLDEAGVDMIGHMQVGEPVDKLYENEDFRSLNREILALAGGNWKQPPKEIDVLEAGLKVSGKIVKLVHKYRSSFWGFKDPRTALTAPLYLPLFEDDSDDLYLVCVFRKPKKVTASMKRRYNLSDKQGAVLVKEYGERIIKLIKEFTGLGGE